MRQTRTAVSFFSAQVQRRRHVGVQSGSPHLPRHFWLFRLQDHPGVEAGMYVGLRARLRLPSRPPRLPAIIAFFVYRQSKSWFACRLVRRRETGVVVRTWLFRRCPVVLLYEVSKLYGCAAVGGFRFCSSFLLFFFSSFLLLFFLFIFFFFIFFSLHLFFFLSCVFPFYFFAFLVLVGSYPATR